MKKKTLLSVIVMLILTASYFLQDYLNPESQDNTAAYTIVFPADRFPETAAHIQSAIQKGHSSICTIDRKGAESNRRESLKGVPTKPNFDRDEFPMAMCAEGGKGADIAYVKPSDNRGAGSWVSNQLEKYPDGTKVAITVK
ncbi:NucA/NucB deoxyribonuclease domain-containing protein [Paenibacillus hodogayensis]|uniref:NucA/NucB deoxyribonuclease domain-containing protein n=1 Tax=Paenibacillus hodogayensis TaxID=279208 RepID=A0ABV5W5F4_9BACL